MREHYKSMSRPQKEKLKEQIEKLEDNEQSQLFQIMKKYTNSFTRTETGVFVSSDVLSDECMSEVEKYISFCSVQKKAAEDHLKLRKSYEKLLNS